MVEFNLFIHLLYANKNRIEVLNIIPYHKSVESITKEIYNKIVDSFYALVVRPMYEGVRKIVMTEAYVTMEMIIPKTFEYLDLWAHCPGAPNSPFGHQNDLEKWFKFLCELRLNHESLSSGNLEQWLVEDLHWEEKVVTDTIIRYETETALLDFYESYVNKLQSFVD